MISMCSAVILSGLFCCIVLKVKSPFCTTRGTKQNLKNYGYLHTAPEYGCHTCIWVPYTVLPRERSVVQQVSVINVMANPVRPIKIYLFICIYFSFKFYVLAFFEVSVSPESKIIAMEMYKSVWQMYLTSKHPVKDQKADTVHLRWKGKQICKLVTFLSDLCF